MGDEGKSNIAAILGGVAAIIVAITGLVVAFKPGPEPPRPAPVAISEPTPAIPSSSTAAASVSSETFSLMGKWNGSRDCVLNFFLDDGENVKGVCDTGVLHTYTGTYLDRKTVSLTITRRDQNGCETKVDASIKFRDKDTIVVSQAGWDGCGVRTPPADSPLFRETQS